MRSQRRHDSELFPKWLNSDIVIYATPLYHYTLNATLKAFIERTLPLLEPFFRQFEGKTYHPMRSKHPKVVFLSVAGFPDPEIFDPLSAWVRYIFGKNKNLIAEIYRPMAEAMGLAISQNKARTFWKPSVRQAMKLSTIQIFCLKP